MNEELKAVTKQAGADLVGVADLEPFKSGGTLLSADLLERFTSAVSVAIHLEDEIIDGIENGQTEGVVVRGNQLRETRAPKSRIGILVDTGSSGIRHEDDQIEDFATPISDLSKR